MLCSNKTKLKSLISKDECDIVIKKALNSNNVEIIYYQIDNANKNILGFLGQYFQMKVTIKNENGEISDLLFFLKSIPLNNESLKEIIETFGFFRKEVSVYKTIFTQMKCQSVERKWHPECFLVRDDMFVFEDLSVLGYRHISKTIQISEDYLKAALTSLARLHSSSFYLEQNILNQKIYEKYKKIIFETWTKENTWIGSGFKLLQTLSSIHPLYGNIYKQQVENKLLHFMDTFFVLIKPSKKFKNVLCHRDLWNKNIMFKKSENSTSCVLLDFQVTGICPPAFDFLQFLYFNTRRKHRDENFKEYQQFYYSALVFESKQLNIEDYRIPSYDEFSESCDYYKIIVLLLAGVYNPITNLPSNYIIDLEIKDPEKYYRVVNVDRSEVVFDYMKENENYRDHLFETVAELIEECINK